MLWTGLNSGGVLDLDSIDELRSGNNSLELLGRLVVLRFTKDTPTKSNRYPQLPVIARAAGRPDTSTK